MFVNTLAIIFETYLQMMTICNHFCLTMPLDSFKMIYRMERRSIRSYPSCHGCRMSPKDCDKDGDFEPGEINRYCQNQVKWLILNANQKYSDGQSDQWPERVGHKTSITKAFFTLMLEPIAEVEVRLDETGVDGRLLRAELQIDPDNLSPESILALRYISGRERKGDYRRWKRQTKYRCK